VVQGSRRQHPRAVSARVSGVSPRTVTWANNVASRSRRPARELQLVAPIDENNARLLGVVAVVGISVIHILDAGSTYHGNRWIFWAYMAPIVSAVPVALLLLHAVSPLVWAAAAALAASPLRRPRNYRRGEP